MWLRPTENLAKYKKVLEIGGGGQPNSQSSVLVDKFLFGEEAYFQRGHADLRTNGKPLIQADGCALPFRAHSFDYVIASHVLEHLAVEEVPLFLSEISRVSSAGYLEVPSIAYEYLFNIPEHKLAFVKKDNLLFGKAKRGSTDSTYLIFRKMLDSEFLLRGILQCYPEVFAISLEWKDVPCVKIVDEEKDLFETNDFEKLWIDEFDFNSRKWRAVSKIALEGIRLYLKWKLPQYVVVFIQCVVKMSRQIIPNSIKKQ